MGINGYQSLINIHLNVGNIFFLIILKVDVLRCTVAWILIVNIFFYWNIQRFMIYKIYFLLEYTKVYDI